MSLGKIEGPGPAGYHPSTVQMLARSASYSMKGKHYFGTSLSVNPNGGHEKLTADNDKKNPGPGAYTVDNKKLFSIPSTKFSHEKRSSMENQSTLGLPAPNAYN